MNHRLTTAIAVAAGIFIALTGVALAQIPGSNGVITACYDNKGNLRVVNFEANESCKSSETQLAWNQAGAQGPQGPVGPPGPAGGARLTVETWSGQVVGELIAYDGVNGAGFGQQVMVRTPQGQYVAYMAPTGQIFTRLVRHQIFASPDCTGPSYVEGRGGLGDLYDFFEAVQMEPLEPMEGIPSDQVERRLITIPHTWVPATAPQYSFRNNENFACTPWQPSPDSELHPLVEVTAPIANNLGPLKIRD